MPSALLYVCFSRHLNTRFAHLFSLSLAHPSGAIHIISHMAGPIFNNDGYICRLTLGSLKANFMLCSLKVPRWGNDLRRMTEGKKN